MIAGNEELAESTSSSLISGSIKSTEQDGVDSGSGSVVGVKTIPPPLDLDNQENLTRNGNGNNRQKRQPLEHVDVEGGLRFWVEPEIKKLAEDVNMQLCQRNGQRLFGPPFGENGQVKAGHGNEVFVAKIPRSCSEIDIFPLFMKMGPVYQIRMMLDFSGTNRGYCFVRFYEKSDAEKAIQELNGYEIRDGRFIGVVRSLDNCRLSISGIPEDKSNKEVREEIMNVTDGVTKVIMVGPDEENILSKRYCLVSYETHRTASIARRCFLTGKKKLWGKLCAVEWGQSDNQLKSIILWNVPSIINEQKIWELCDSVSRGQACSVKRSSYGYTIDFKSHQGAEVALEALNEMEIEGQNILGVFVKSEERELRRRYPPGRAWKNRQPRNQNQDNSRYVGRRPWGPPRYRYQFNENTNFGRSGGFRQRNSLPNIHQFHNNGDVGIRRHSMFFDQQAGLLSGPNQLLPPMEMGNMYLQQPFMTNNNYSSSLQPGQVPWNINNMQSNLHYNNQPQARYGNLVQFDHSDPVPLQSLVPNNSDAIAVTGNNVQKQDNVFNFDQDVVNAFQSMTVGVDNRQQYGYNGQYQTNMTGPMFSPLQFPGMVPTGNALQSPLFGLLGRHNFVAVDQFAPNYV